MLKVQGKMFKYKVMSTTSGNVLGSFSWIGNEEVTYDRVRRVLVGRIYVFSDLL